jgi:hypothetical protein
MGVSREAGYILVHYRRLAGARVTVRYSATEEDGWG